jgi:hypothetical protein
MKIFHYHPDTCVLLGEGVADQSPLEPGHWLIPAYATTSIPPLAGENEQVVMVNNKWEVQLIPEPQPVVETAPGPIVPSVPVDQEQFQQLTAEQKLNAFGLTVAELKELFGLN